MVKLVRYALFLVCAVQFFLAVAFFLQLALAVNLWPFPGTTPLTFIFVSSIFAAAATSTLWATASGNYGALAGIGLDYVAILAPLAAYCLQIGPGSVSSPFVGYGFACIFGVVFGLALFLWSVRIPIAKDPPMPVVVRWSFVFFIVALVVVSIRLLLKTPNIIPWTISPELSVAIGWMFVGAAAYFAYGLLRPSWANSAGQLAGFLAYDVVLIVPFLLRLPTVGPDQRPGLTIYTAVVIYSGLLAIYFLFIHRTTRVFSRRT
jgi:hypothetical protein